MKLASRLPMLMALLLVLVSPFAFATTTLAADQGTLRLTLRGCPDGVDPTTTSRADQLCDVPLDAPDAAFVEHGGDGQGGLEVRYMEREWDGTYTTTVPARRTLNLIGFEPEVRNSYAMTNVDDRDRDGNFDVRVGEGRTLTVRVFYYNSPAPTGGNSPGQNQRGSATVRMTFRGCPDTVDARYVDPFTVCTIPLDAPDASVAFWGEDGGVSIPRLPRTYNGTYELVTPPGILTIALVDIEPVLRNAYVIYGTDQNIDNFWGIFLYPGEVREVWVFYYYR